MKLPEAIELLQELDRHSSAAFAPGELDALNLGIEALKRILNDRELYSYMELQTLPSETEAEPQPTREEVKKYMADRASL